jgi:flagellar basal body rod protein FlgB
MNLTSLITDNITEILIKIVKFTQSRQKILVQNIINLHNPGFVPKELEVDEFSNVLNNAIDEHVQNKHLVLCDTENIKFRPAGDLELRPIVDKHGERLLEENQDEYIEWQIGKLWENSLSQKIAAELLRQKVGPDKSAVGRFC